MMQEISLREEERAAVKERVEALHKLEAELAETPTPAGQAPGELSVRRPVPVPSLEPKAVATSGVSSRCTTIF